MIEKSTSKSITIAKTKFISRDSFAGRRFDPLSLNLYTYCRNNPIRYIDPSGHSYATLPDGTSMTINSAGDAERFYLLRDKQLVDLSEKALSFGKYTVSNVVSAFKRGYIRNNSYDVPTYDQFIMMSKKRTARPAEEKVRGLRNKQKRQDYNKKKGNSNNIVLPDPYGLDNFREAVDDLYMEEMPVNQSSFGDVLEGSGMIILSSAAMIFIVGDNITGVGAADDELLVPLEDLFKQGLQMLT